MSSPATGSGVKRDLRYQQVLNRLVAAGAITPSGRDFLIMAIDPFHDVRLANLQGYPDTQVGESVVQNVPRQLTITRPSGFTQDTWSFLVVAYPWIGMGVEGAGLTLIGAIKMDNVLMPDGSSTQPVFPFSVYAVDGGTTPVGPFANASHVSGLGLNSDIGYGPGRVIGTAFELWDETAQLYKQGGITVWRQNTSVNNHNSYTQATGGGDPFVRSAIGVGTYNLMMRPPETVAEANFLSNTLSWPAWKGCYSVSVLNEEQNKAKMPHMTQPLFVRSDTQSGPNSVQQGVAGTSVLVGHFGISTFHGTGEPMVGQLAPSQSFSFQPYHMHGAFVTGLHPSASFKMVTRCIYEQFPSLANEALTHLTKPSANHDPLALQIYDQALCGMPVSVFVDENSFGEWFEDIARKAAKMASLSGIPGLSQVGQAGQLAFDAYDMFKDDKKKTTKKKKKTNPNVVLPPTTVVGQPKPKAVKRAARPKGPPPLPKKSAANGYRPRRG